MPPSDDANEAGNLDRFVEKHRSGVVAALVTCKTCELDVKPAAYEVRDDWGRGCALRKLVPVAAQLRKKSRFVGRVLERESQEHSAHTAKVD